MNSVMKAVMAIEKPYQRTRKEIWPAIIGGAISVGTSVLGGMSAARANKRAEDRQRMQEAKEDAWYNRRYNEDYADTAAGQNLIKRAKDIAQENWRKAAGAQAVAGGTAAASQMAKDAGNRMVGDTIANIAATDQARKANVDAQHRQAEQGFMNMDIAREQQRAQNITAAAQSASNAAMSVAGALDQSSVKPANLQGGSNAGASLPPQYTKVDSGKVKPDSSVLTGSYDSEELTRLLSQ